MQQVRAAGRKSGGDEREGAVPGARSLCDARGLGLPPSPPEVSKSHIPQVAAKLQEAERKLHDQEVVLKAVTLERDQALRTHGLLPEQELQVSTPSLPALPSRRCCAAGPTLCWRVSVRCGLRPPASLRPSLVCSARRPSGGGCFVFRRVWFCLHSPRGSSPPVLVSP